MTCATSAIFFKVVAQKMCYLNLNIFYRSVNIIKYLNIMSLSWFTNPAPPTSLNVFNAKNVMNTGSTHPCNDEPFKAMPLYHPMAKVHSTKLKGCLNHNLEKNKFVNIGKTHQPTEVVIGSLTDGRSVLNFDVIDLKNPTCRTDDLQAAATAWRKPGKHWIKGCPRLSLDRKSPKTPNL